MKKERFDLFDSIELTEAEKKFLEVDRIISDLVFCIIRRRFELKMSQRDLANATGIKQPMIARIENFTSVPRLDTLVRMAKALGMTLSFEEPQQTTYIINVKTEQNPSERIYKFDNLKNRYHNKKELEYNLG